MMNWKKWEDTDEHGDGPNGENGRFIVGTITNFEDLEGKYHPLLVTCGRQRGALENEELVETVIRAVNSHEALVAVVKEFVKDVETVGEDTLKATDKQEPQEWPDLFVTYHHAVQALKTIGAEQ